MSRYMRRAARIDNNQKEIVKSLRDIPSVTVATNHDDILVGFEGKTYWYEIKSQRALNKDGKVRENEKPWSEKTSQKVERTLQGSLQSG